MWLGTKRALVLCAVLGVVGTWLLTNPYMLGVHGFGEADWDSPFKVKLASLLSVFFYLAPPVAVLVGHRVLAPWPKVAGPLRAVLSGRVRTFAYLTAIFAAGVLVAGAVSYVQGRPLEGGDFGRAIACFIVIQQVGATFYWIGATCSVGSNNARRALVTATVIMAVIIVGFTLLSDLILFHTFGQMPLPGTPEWAEYLKVTANSAGMYVYYVSPVELSLTLMTGAIAMTGGAQLAGFTMFGVGMHNLVAFVAFVITFLIRRSGKGMAYGLDHHRGAAH
jgi:hypothetical protein